MPTDLMTRVQAGDFAAFELLYDRYWRFVYGIALRIVQDEAAAEHVAQAVFLKIWTAPGSYRSGDFSAWLARAVRDRALDEIRGRRTGAEFRASGDAVEGAEGPMPASLRGEDAVRFLAQLPQEEREPIELAFFAGLSNREIAAATGTSVETVKARLRSGLRRIRETLSGQE